MPPKVVLLPGGNYFFKPPSILGAGRHGDSDHPNYYADNLIEGVYKQEDHYHPLRAGAPPHQVAFDFNNYKPKPEHLACNELNFGGNGNTLEVLNNSENPPRVYSLQHSVGTVPSHPAGTLPSPNPGRLALMEALKEIERPETSTRLAANVAPSPQATIATAAPILASHDPLFSQIQSGVTLLDVAHGRNTDVSSRNMTASLFQLAREHHFERVDHVLMSIHGTHAKAGENVFIVMGNPSDPAHLRASMKTMEAITTPESDSLQRANELPLPRALTPEQEQRQVQQRPMMQ